jgi:hypothetical protein
MSERTRAKYGTRVKPNKYEMTTMRIAKHMPSTPQPTTEDRMAEIQRNLENATIAQKSETKTHSLQVPVTTFEDEFPVTPEEEKKGKLITAFTNLHEHRKTKPVVDTSDHHSNQQYQQKQLDKWHEEHAELRKKAKEAHKEAHDHGITEAKKTFFFRTPYISHKNHGTIYSGGKRKTRKHKKKNKRKTKRNYHKKRKTNKKKKYYKKKRKTQRR